MSTLDNLSKQTAVAILGSTLGDEEKEIQTQGSDSTRAALARPSYKISL